MSKRQHLRNPNRPHNPNRPGKTNKPAGPGGPGRIPSRPPAGARRVICNVCERASSPAVIAQPNEIHAFGFFFPFISNEGQIIPQAGLVICSHCMNVLIPMAKKIVNDYLEEANDQLPPALKLASRDVPTPDSPPIATQPPTNGHTAEKGIIRKHPKDPPDDDQPEHSSI